MNEPTPPTPPPSGEAPPPGGPPPAPPGTPPPGGAPPGAGAAPAGNPWEQRDRLGFVNALVENLKLFITSPGEGFRRTQRKGDFGSPLLYAVILSWVAYVVGQIWRVVFGTSILAFLPGEARHELGAVMAGSAAGFVVQVILAPIFIVVGLFIWSAILHLFLMLYGALGQSESGYEGTLRTLSYSSVANLAQIVPIAGGLIALVWGIILQVIGLAEMHRTSQGKATAAVLTPLILCCVCVAIVVVVSGAAIMHMIQGAR